MYSFVVVELLGQQFEYIHNAITITSGFVLTIYLRICFKILNNLGIQYSYIYQVLTNTFYFTFQVRFTGYRDRPLHERQTKFICALREGHTEIVSIFLSNFTFKKYRYRINMNIEKFTYFHEEHLFFFIQGPLSKDKMVWALKYILSK